MPLPDPLPEPLQTLVLDQTWTEVSIGQSGAQVFASGTRFLKIQPLKPLDTLLDEKDRMDWLRGKMPVPEVLFYGCEKKVELLLTSRVTGQDLSVLAQENPERAVRWFAQGLKRWHSVPVAGCPFDRTFQAKLQEAHLRLELGLVDTSSFTETAPDGVLSFLASRNVTEDLVLTHGDYCFPNVLVQEGEIQGFIDVGRAGVSDRYTDLTLALWSTAYNCGPGWEEVFLQEYGLPQLDREKLKLFSLLDRFF